MSGTTVKLEGELLAAIEAVRPPKMSVSAFVRDVLQQTVDRAQTLKAAREYRDFLATNPEEVAWLDEWEASDLSAPPMLVHEP